MSLCYFFKCTLFLYCLYTDLVIFLTICILICCFKVKKRSSDYDIPDAFFNDHFDDIITVEDTSNPIKEKRRSSNDSRSSTDSFTFKRKNQASLLDAGFSRTPSESVSTSFRRTGSFEKKGKSQQPKITNFGQRSIVEADSTTPVSSQVQAAVTIDQSQNAPIVTSDLMVFVDVKIEGRVFRVPVLLSQVQTNTIGWLAEQAANKYARYNYSLLFVLHNMSKSVGFGGKKS